MKSISMRIVVLCLALLWTAPAWGGAKLSLMLDWFPNVDHLPIYSARHQGLFDAAGLDLEIIAPSDTSDALKLAASGRIDLAISYEPQTIIGAARGLDIVAVGRLIEHPLTTLMFLDDKGIESPRDLSGKRIGYTVPGLMDILLHAFARVNGIASYSTVNVGFAIVQSLTSGRVDAVLGPFKTYETVEMTRRGYSVSFFEIEKHGIPDYDELVFVSNRRIRQKKKTEIELFMQVLSRSIADMRRDPATALAGYFEEVPEADRQTETEAFRLTLPYYAHHLDLDPVRWQQFADFALEYGLIDQPVDVYQLIDRQ
jgi:putative hydroxymethylpyrimidine transport system substrate-binding protein